jgi:hypothetical protein
MYSDGSTSATMPTRSVNDAITCPSIVSENRFEEVGACVLGPDRGRGGKHRTKHRPAHHTGAVQQGPPGYAPAGFCQLNCRWPPFLPP